VSWRAPDSRWFDEAEWEAAPTCSMPAALPRPGNFPKSVKLVQHLHLRRTCLSEYLPWKTDPCPSIMSSTTMNPGFLTSSDELQLDEKLHPALKKLIIEKYSTSLAPASIKLIKAGAADKVSRMPMTSSELHWSILVGTEKSVLRASPAGVHP